MIDEKTMENDYRERLEEDIITSLAAERNIDYAKAMSIYYSSKLADRIANGVYGIQYLDYRVLTRILQESEPELFN